LAGLAASYWELFDEGHECPYTENEQMTVTVKNRTPLTVPDRVRRRAGFKPGDEVEFKASGGVVTILAKLPLADEEYTPAQRRIIDARLDEAEKGPFYGPFNTMDDMIAHLKAEVKRRKSAKKSKRHR
jgi:bifunctional DNA-binding transcriptional regulator/antitoxin component of YhaV-PrlF toxin-antitoxin module